MIKFVQPQNEVYVLQGYRGASDYVLHVAVGCSS